MKKLVVISVMAAMLLSASVIAMAAGTATDWTILMKASDTTWGSAAGLIQIGTKAAAVDAKDINDGKYTANFGNQAQVVSYEPGFPDSPAYYSKDFKAPVGAAPQTWNLLVWAGSTYTKDVLRLAWYSTAALTPPAIAGWEYAITVVNDPTGTYAKGTKWVLEPGMLGSSTAPAGYVDFNNIQTTLKIADASAIDSAIQLELKAGAVPEPSSMMALASGLVGMAGFAIRRRRA